MTGSVIEVDRDDVETAAEEPGLPPPWRRCGVALTVALTGTALVAAAPPPGPSLVEFARVVARRW